MPLTQIQPGSYEAASINTTDLGANVTATYATYAAVAANLTPRITTVNVANSSYTVLDDTAVNTAGGYLVITGANFQSGAIVTIDTTNATSTTFINSTTLRVQTQSRTAGSYNLYVTNPDGGTAIKILGVTYSNTPIWGTAATLSGQVSNTAFAVNISANSDSAVTYSNTTALPAGTTLLANGLFYGTVSIGAETTYSFDVNAIDAELQDTPRTFSLTVTVPPPWITGTLWVWGADSDGQSGLNVPVGTTRSSPVQVGSDTTWTSEQGSNNFSRIAIKTNNTLWAWGFNPDGILGLNDVINRSSPVQIGTATNWSKVGQGQGGTCFFAIKTDGTLWTWGPSNAVMGLNDAIHHSNNRSSPTQIGTETTWNGIWAGQNVVTATKTDNTLWVWGSGSNGSLGLNDVINRSSPTQVTFSNWSKINVGQFLISIVKTDGTLWMFGGNNIQGVYGNDTAVNVSSPIQIGSSTNWREVWPGQTVCFGVKTDGTAWVWGSSAYGNTGLNDLVSRSSPTQLGSLTTWKSGRIFGGHALAITTSNQLFTWGRNINGMLGDNITYGANRSSPAQVGSATNWQFAQIGGTTTAFALRS